MHKPQQKCLSQDKGILYQKAKEEPQNTPISLISLLSTFNFVKTGLFIKWVGNHQNNDIISGGSLERQGQGTLKRTQNSVVFDSGLSSIAGCDLENMISSVPLSPKTFTSMIPSEKD